MTGRRTSPVRVEEHPATISPSASRSLAGPSAEQIQDTFVAMFRVAGDALAAATIEQATFRLRPGSGRGSAYGTRGGYSITLPVPDRPFVFRLARMVVEAFEADRESGFPVVEIAPAGLIVVLRDL